MNNQMPIPTIKICYFPGRETSYARNRVLVKGMRAAGLEVYDCSSTRRDSFRYLAGFIRFLCNKHQCDVIFIGFLGHFLVPLVKLFTQKKILFDAFLSIYQTMAFDRQTFAGKSPLIAVARFLDRFSCQLADDVLLDTQQHIDFFLKEYSLNARKFHRLLVGSDDSVMYPRDDAQGEKDFLVHFHGEFQGLHGAPHIIEAAKILPHIKFQMIGTGRKHAECVARAKKYQLTNIQFIQRVTYEQLAEYLSRATVCLGLFGNTIKTQTVIPHKVYEAMAMRKPVITADTPAIKELLVHRESVYLCEEANPASLAKAIEELKMHPALRHKIALNGYQVFRTKCTPAILGQEVKGIVEKMVRN
jgi:glycosyltransferase involved in cell wall biosynthesis